MVSLHHIIVANAFFLLLTYSSAFDAIGSYCAGVDTSGPVSTNIARLLANTTRQFERGARFLEPSSGKGNNLVYGLAQCWADTDQKTCLGCIHDAAQQIPVSCTGESDARIWYDQCVLRYSLEKFYGTLDTSNGYLLGNQANVTNVKSFNKILRQLFQKLESDVVAPSGVGFSTGMRVVSKFDTLYGIARCTKDVTSKLCGDCLDAAIQNFGGFCSGRKGCRVFYGSCSIRYELYNFLSSNSVTSRKVSREGVTEFIVRK